jgi:osmotically-inducible protein OsmY
LAPVSVARESDDRQGKRHSDHPSLRSLHALDASRRRAQLKPHQHPEDEMRTDSDIKRDVEAELKWDPDIDPTDIAVAVKGGVVTLTGFVRSYSQKYQAEGIAKRVLGVVGIANDIQVRLPSESQRPDPEITRDAVAALKTELPYSYANIKVIAKDGWLTLEGSAEWNYQRNRAEDAMLRIKGVKGVRNLIVLKPRVAPSEIRSKIEEAFRRNAELEAKNVTIEANGSEVILKGTLRSWAERQEAERAAWRAPGVTKVDNRITIGF